MLPQIKYYRQRFITYAIKNDVIKASIRYKISRKTIYKWLKRYDGTLQSLEDLSRRPKNSPKKHTEDEIKIIKRLVNKYNTDIILIYQILRQKFNYNRSYGGLKAFIRKLINPTKNKKVTSKWKEYKRADYIGQKVQTDNGVEFTNLQRKYQEKIMFEMMLDNLDIKYTRTRIATPRHNGKVERQHRQDSERFYKHLKMFDLTDGRKQPAKYQLKSNNYIKTCLGFKSPNQVVEQYLFTFLNI